VIKKFQELHEGDLIEVKLPYPEHSCHYKEGFRFFEETLKLYKDEEGFICSPKSNGYKKYWIEEEYHYPRYYYLRLGRDQDGIVIQMEDNICHSCECAWILGDSIEVLEE